MSFGVKTICRLTGLNRSTLLAWERRYNVVEPERGDNGYRLYTDADLVRLQSLKALVDRGHRVSEAVRLLDRSGPRDATLESLRAELLTELRAFRRDDAIRVAERARVYPPMRQLRELYLPLLRLVGAGWALGEISVAQEHFTSGICRTQMLSLLAQVAPARGTESGVVALLTPTGERHELGLLAAGVSAAAQGWAVDWLGLELPTMELSAYCAASPPQLVCVAVVAERSASELATLAEGLRLSVPAAIPVVLGGAALRDAPDTLEGCLVLHTLSQMDTLLQSLTPNAAGGAQTR
jgi:DNA-binding transcriptional MerR regulator